MALRDPYFSTHYKRLPPGRTAARCEDDGDDGGRPRGGGAGAAPARAASPVRSGRELHLEVAVDAANRTIEDLSSRLEEMRAELDSKTEEACALRVLLERERSGFRQQLLASSARHAHELERVAASVSGIRSCGVKPRAV